VSSKYPLKNVEISEKIGEMMSLQKDTKTGSGENLTNGKKQTDEAHVPHNFKSMESGPMTNVLQTSKS
jgi:hypothetical protein